MDDERHMRDARCYQSEGRERGAEALKSEALGLSLETVHQRPLIRPQVDRRNHTSRDGVSLATASAVVVGVGLVVWVSVGGRWSKSPPDHSRSMGRVEPVGP